MNGAIFNILKRMNVPCFSSTATARSSDRYSAVDRYLSTQRQMAEEAHLTGLPEAPG